MTGQGSARSSLQRNWCHKERQAIMASRLHFLVLGDNSGCWCYHSTVIALASCQRTFGHAGAPIDYCTYRSSERHQINGHRTLTTVPAITDGESWSPARPVRPTHQSMTSVERQGTQATQATQATRHRRHGVHGVHREHGVHRVHRQHRRHRLQGYKGDTRHRMAAYDGCCRD